MKYIQYLCLLISFFSVQAMDQAVVLDSQNKRVKNTKICGNLRQLISSSYTYSSQIFKKLTQLFTQRQWQYNFPDNVQLLILSKLDPQTLNQMKIVEQSKNRSWPSEIKTLIAEKNNPIDILKMFTIFPKECGIAGHHIYKIISSQDKQYMVTISVPTKGQRYYMVAIWDISTREPIRNFVQKEKITCAAVSADNTLVLTGSIKGATLWDIETGNEIASYATSEPVSGVNFTEESHLEISADKRIIIDYETSEILTTQEIIYDCSEEQSSNKLLLECAGSRAMLFARDHDLKCIKQFDYENAITASLLEDDFFVVALSGKLLMYDFFDTNNLV